MNVLLQWILRSFQMDGYYELISQNTQIHQYHLYPIVILSIILFSLIREFGEMMSSKESTGNKIHIIQVLVK